MDAAWLMGYDVPLKPQLTPGGMSNYEIASLINKLRNDSQMQNVLKNYNTLNDPNKQMIENLILELVKRSD